MNISEENAPTEQEILDFFQSFNEENECFPKLKLKEKNREKNIYKFQILDEDHTLGNLLYETLEQDKRVASSCFEIPHPTSNEIILTVQLKSSDDVQKILIQAIEKVQEEISTFQEEYKNAIA